VLTVIAIGGALGAEARYGAMRAVPSAHDAFPAATLIINVTGSFLIGVLMAVLLQLSAPHRLARPFLGVGVLGGYTTYSTYAVEVQRLLTAHRPGIAFSYVVATVVGCAVAVWLATALTLAIGRRLPRRRAMAAASDSEAPDAHPMNTGRTQ
jgi:CrcB protein